VRDFASVAGHATVDAKIADAALTRLEVDARGLDGFDKRYLKLIAEGFGGGPVGIETIAAALGESRDAIEDVVEPFLLQQGFVQRTPRGRLLTGAAYGHLGLAAPPRDPQQMTCRSPTPMTGAGRALEKTHVREVASSYEDADLSGVRLALEASEASGQSSASAIGRVIC